MTQIKFHAPWHQLKKVIVGRSYPPSFYDPIRSDSTRTGLQQIAQETEEDYLALINVLRSMNIEVLRPDIDSHCTIMDFVDRQGQLSYADTASYTLIPKPPMQPRDSLLPIGDQLLLTNKQANQFRSLVGDCVTTAVSELDGFEAPCVNVIGDTLVVDCKDHAHAADLLRQICPQYKIRATHIGGHTDAVFCLPKPGLVLSTHHHHDYKDTFPGWRIEYIENLSWNAIPEWRQIKRQNHDRWWVPDSISNPEFDSFVDTWLHTWLGFVSETVFDINMLQIDSRTILVNNYNQRLFDLLRQHQIEPIVVPFRHRFFWDGGLHCITADLYREGEMENYA